MNSQLCAFIHSLLFCLFSWFYQSSKRVTPMDFLMQTKCNSKNIEAKKDAIIITMVTCHPPVNILHQSSHQSIHPSVSTLLFIRESIALWRPRRMRDAAGCEWSWRLWVASIPGDAGGFERLWSILRHVPPLRISGVQDERCGTGLKRGSDSGLS